MVDITTKLIAEGSPLSLDAAEEITSLRRQCEELKREKQCAWDQAEKYVNDGYAIAYDMIRGMESLSLATNK